MSSKEGTYHFGEGLFSVSESKLKNRPPEETVPARSADSMPGCVYIRALHAVLVAVQRLDIDREFRSHTGAGNAGLFSSLHQVIVISAIRHFHLFST